MRSLLVLLLVILCFPVDSNSNEAQPLFVSILLNTTIQDLLNVITAIKIFFRSEDFFDFKQKLESSDSNLFKKISELKEGLDLEMAAISEQAKDFSDRIIMELSRFLPPSNTMSFDPVSIETHLNDIAEMYLNLDPTTKAEFEKKAPSIKFILDWFSTQMKDIHTYVKNPLLAISKLT
ncbi:unnamed protein product [Bursaphelenchus xylophilus]|uniref:(pine wood nematode) hypothetical protein n=1 Tax=Bursaphelenchus xylophilus TaxID=6326 RepID=A0A1I7RH46_BURXY|nr:unnamed protein product [Bursaphelenchus xylophilus]CAG9115980.1 unnamed protein product [Bursaphelenchus xylophilus]